MNKRKLSALPRPEVKEQFKELRQMVSGMRGIVTAERIDVDGENTLVINCFKLEDKTVVPWFRTFCQEDGYITQDLTEQKVKWRTAAFDYIVGFYISNEYRTESHLVLATPQDGETIISFMQEWRTRNHTSRCDAGFKFEDYIDAYQADIRDRKLAEKHRKICEKIDKRMELFGELPPDYQQFVEKTVFDDYNYFFYSKKAKRAFCTRCGHEYEIRKDGVYHRKIAVWNDIGNLKHNTDYICPHCNKAIMAKSEGYGRQGLLEVNWSVLVQPSGDNVLVRYFCHTKDFRKDFRRPKIESREMFRTIHTPTSREDYELEIYTYNQKVRWCYPRGHGYDWNPSEFKVPRSTVLYNTDFGFLADTCMRYSCIEVFMGNIVTTMRRTSAWIVDQYFSFYHEHPFVEQMLKIGWYKIVRELFENGNIAGIKSGRTISETLGISREHFLLLREATGNNPRIRDVKIIRYAEQTGKRLTVKDLRELSFVKDDGYMDLYEKYIDAMEYTTLHKLTAYITKQNIKHGMDYFDYVRWLSEMGYDMRNEFNLFPRDFKKAHDERSEEYVKYQNKKKREEMKRFNKWLKKLCRETADMEPMKLKVAGLFIRLPKRLEELKTEGEVLHHCVGTYRDRVAKGETMIFFIRREAEPEKPFYTMEWKGRVVQCRGFHNCDMTPEVKAFVEIFQEKMTKYENGLQIQRKAG